MQSHQLHAQANPQHGRFAARIQRLQHGQLEHLAKGIDLVRLGVGRHAPMLHDWIVAAGKNNAIASPDVHLDTAT